MNACAQHPRRGPRDTLPSGQCRHCDRIRQARYHERRKVAMALLHQMEAAGLKESELKPDDGFAIALRWADAVDEGELQRIEREHPALIEKVLNRLRHVEAVDGL